MCANGCHPRSVFAAVIVVIGREWDRTPTPKFVQPSCTTTTNRIQVSEMLAHEGGRGAQEGRAQVHAAPGRQAKGQGQRVATSAGETGAPH